MKKLFRIASAIRESLEAGSVLASYRNQAPQAAGTSCCDPEGSGVTGSSADIRSGSSPPAPIRDVIHPPYRQQHRSSPLTQSVTLELAS